MNLKPGDKIRIIEMQGEPDYTDRIGTVKKIDDAGQVHGTWGGLALQPERDKIEPLKDIMHLKYAIYEVYNKDLSSWIAEALTYDLAVKIADLWRKENPHRAVRVRECITSLSTFELRGVVYEQEALEPLPQF